MGILKSRGFVKKEKTLLQNAEEVVADKLDENYDNDLIRVGAMWSGLLGLDQPIPASEVAAMLSCVELIRATTLVDSAAHWTNAAAYVALAYETEPDVEEELDPLIGKNKSDKNPIGFGVQSNSEALSTE